MSCGERGDIAIYTGMKWGYETTERSTLRAGSATKQRCENTFNANSDAARPERLTMSTSLKDRDQRLGSVVRWRWSSGAVIAVVVAIVALGVIFAIKYWDWLNAGEDSPGPTVRTVSLIIGGAVAVVLTLWRSILSERQWRISQDQAEVAQRQARIAQDSLLNQRYERATEMLSSQVPVVRLGGVYALSNLAKDHPEQYHLPVIELLCAYLRNPTEFEDDAAISLVNDNPNIRPIVREDVQAAFRAVVHRSTAGIEIERRQGLLHRPCSD